MELQDVGDDLVVGADTAVWRNMRLKFSSVDRVRPPVIVVFLREVSTMGRFSYVRDLYVWRMVRVPASISGGHNGATKADKLVNAELRDPNGGVKIFQ